MTKPQLNDEYRTFLKNCKRPDVYTNTDHTAELMKHYNLSEDHAEHLRAEFVREVFINMPWKPSND